MPFIDPLNQTIITELKKQQYSIERFISGTGSFSVQSDIHKINIILVGAGGGGVSGNNGGGGGGEVLFVNDLAVDPSSSISYSVGAGSSGDGGNTQFGNLFASGGKAGTGSTGGAGGGGSNNTAGGGLAADTSWAWTDCIGS